MSGHGLQGRQHHADKLCWIAAQGLCRVFGVGPCFAKPIGFVQRAPAAGMWRRVSRPPACRSWALATTASRCIGAPCL